MNINKIVILLLLLLTHSDSNASSSTSVSSDDEFLASSDSCSPTQIYEGCSPIQIWALAQSQGPLLVMDDVGLRTLSTIRTLKRVGDIPSNPTEIEEFMNLYKEKVIECLRALAISLETSKTTFLTPPAGELEMSIVADISKIGKDAKTYPPFLCDHLRLMTNYLKFISRYVQPDLLDGRISSSYIPAVLEFNYDEFLKLLTKHSKRDEPGYIKMLQYFGNFIDRKFTANDRYDGAITSVDQFRYFMDRCWGQLREIEIIGNDLLTRGVADEHILKTSDGQQRSITVMGVRYSPIIRFKDVPTMCMTEFSSLQTLKQPMPMVKLINLSMFAETRLNTYMYAPFNAATKQLSPHMRRQLFTCMRRLSDLLPAFHRTTNFRGFVSAEDIIYMSERLSKMVILRIWWGEGATRRISVETNKNYIWFDGSGAFGDTEALDTMLPDLTVPIFAMDTTRLDVTLNRFRHGGTKWSDGIKEKATEYRNLEFLIRRINPYTGYVEPVKDFARIPANPINPEMFDNPYNLGIYLLMLSNISKWVRDLYSFKDSSVEFELGALCDHHSAALGELAAIASIKSFAESLSSRRQHTIPDLETRKLSLLFLISFASIRSPINPTEFELIDITNKDKLALLSKGDLDLKKQKCIDDIKRLMLPQTMSSERPEVSEVPWIKLIEMCLPILLGKLQHVTLLMPEIRKLTKNGL